MTRLLKAALLILVAAGLSACSSGSGVTAVTDANGNHPSDWLQKHWAAAQALKGTLPENAEAAVAGSAFSCAECHGKDLKGGVSRVSCFSSQGPSGAKCHPDTLGHPADWKNPLRHGKGVIPAGTPDGAFAGAMGNPGQPASGFAYCRSCHGSDLRGGTGLASSCFKAGGCHNGNAPAPAPHPLKPWTGGTVSHTDMVGSGQDNATVCFGCHALGNNFSGPAPAVPSSTPGCFNNSMCHGSLETVTAVHLRSATYKQPAAHGADAAGRNPQHPEYGIGTCQGCHADANARFNLAINNMPGGCESQGCHAPFTAHPVPWVPGRTMAGARPAGPTVTSHATVAATSFTTECTRCHGQALDGVGSRGNAPSCTTNNPQLGIRCHATSPVATPTGCASCHPGFVSLKPVNGSHTVHLALAGVSCDACHSGGGADPATRIGGPRHADGFLNVSSAVYWAKSGGFRYNAATGTCANVRCHGGGDPVTHNTPTWNGGTLDPATDCLKCHQQGDRGNLPQAPQFNSFYSGNFSGINLHQFHLAPNALFPALPVFCTDCHTMTAQHFAGLASQGFDTDPGDTVANPAKFGSYDKVLGRCSNVACHHFAPVTLDWGK